MIEFQIWNTEAPGPDGWTRIPGGWVYSIAPAAPPGGGDDDDDDDPTVFSVLWCFRPYRPGRYCACEDRWIPEVTREGSEQTSSLPN